MSACKYSISASKMQEKNRKLSWKDGLEGMFWLGLHVSLRSVSDKVRIEEDVSGGGTEEGLWE